MNLVKRRWLPLLLVTAASLAGAAGCAGSPRIEISGEKARLSPALIGVCSIFLRIANGGDGDDALVGASVDVPGALTEIHDVRDGKMVRTDHVVVPARGSLELRPGGLHIMVFKLPGEIGTGSELKLRLVFKTSGEKVTSVRIAG